MSPIRTCVIGLGYWGTNLCRVLAESPRFDLRGLVDVKDAGAPTLDVAVRRDGPFEAVVIATPATTHFDLALDALERGYHVLVEKPLALSSVEGEKLCAAARAHDRVLHVDHTYLASPRFETFDLVLNLWAPWSLWTSIRQHDGGPWDVSTLWDLIPHDLALLHASGFRAQSVMVVGDAERGLLDLSGVDGRRALITYSRRAALKVRLIQVQTEAGLVTWDDLAELPVRVTRKGVERDLSIIRTHEPLAGLVEDFADAIEDRTCRYPARSSGVAAVWGLRVLEAAERSIANGGKIELL